MMYYLSRVTLDLTRRNTMKALASANLIHGAIEKSFEGPRRRNLWRVDTVGGHTYLLILSDGQPELSNVCTQFSPQGVEKAWESKPYEPLLGRIHEGDVWHFRLTANPTHSSKKDGGERGKVYGHITPEYQKQWLMDRSEKNGFHLEGEDFRVVERRWLRFHKGPEGGRPVTLLSVTYEGILKVTDSEAFKHVLCKGIGRGKAYGLGLLTVAKR